MSHSQSLSPKLDHDRIVAVVGQVDDAKIAAIEATGASLEQLEEAVAWTVGESDVMGESRLPLSGVVAEIYDILTADEDDAEERA